MPSNDGRFVCRSCGQSFHALQHMRSHQARSCSTPTHGSAIPRDNDRDDALPPLSEVVCETEDIGEPEAVQHDISSSSSLLRQLDNRRRVADDIFHFYNCLTQRSELIVTELVSLAEHVRECHSVVQQFIENCSDRSLSKKAIGALYTTISNYEASLPQECRLVTKFIPRLSHLYAVLKALRAEKLFTEQWRRTIIDLNDLHAHLRLTIPINKSGTFRCPLILLKKQLQKHGSWAIQTFRKSNDANGDRTFSCPCDSYALEMYSRQVGENGVVVTVDVYCDGIALPNNGSQTISPLRVRFSNIRGIQTTWFEIGICPTLHMGNTMCTGTKITELRSELLQRYLFLVFKALMEASSVGFRLESTLIFPRILMVLCDQRQERPLVALKSSNSTRDCTTCYMVSRMTSAKVTSRLPTTQPPPRKRRKVRSNESSDSVSATESDSSQATSAAEKKARKAAEKAAYAAECLQRQLDSRPAAARNVTITLGAQIILAISKLKVKKGETNELVDKLRLNLHSSWFDFTDSQLKELRHFSMVYSFCEYPPCLAAFHGLGTEPFLIYKSIAFDTLHAIDLGILRVFPESCFQHFGTSTNFTTLPTTQCISIANSRLMYIPRGVQLHKKQLFIGKESEQLAGVTGLMRRQTSPFLWICILGLNTILRPDDDPLVNAALQLNKIQSVLLGINEDVSSIHRSQRWIADVQEQCFQLGVQYTSLFNIPVNTKLHRTMRHIKDHLTSFGLLRWGATDQNESQHRALKKGYSNTNRWPHSLAVQLLKTGYAYIAPDCEVEDISESHDSRRPQCPPDQIHESAGLASTIHELASSRSFGRRLDKVLHLKYSQNKSTVWTKLSYITLKITVPWAVNRDLQYVRDKFTYRPWCTSTESIRMDGCVYNTDGSTSRGLVQLILRNKKHPGEDFLVVRRLGSASSDPGNTNPVLKYNHMRFKYATNCHGDLQLDLVPTSAVQYPIFLVVDPTVLVKHFGVHSTTVDLLESDNHRQKSCFFQIQGVPLTSFKEYLLKEDNTPHDAPAN